LAYPYFLHPAKGMIRTATIYMVVAISAERFKAICYPLR
jgi:predicted membrane-bound spermidine synthase